MEKHTFIVFAMIIILMLVLGACAKSTPVPATSPSGGSSSGGTVALDGKTILEAKCQSCHSLAPIYNTQQTVNGWTQIVDNMIQRGASLTADERTTLINYLAATYK